MPSVYLLDEGGPTRISGKNSTFEVVWQTIGYTSNPARKSAVTSATGYVASVVADGYTLDNQEWLYERQVADKYKVRIIYSHKENARNKTQNPVLQNEGDEETRISYSSINVPITEAISQNRFGESPDMGNSIEYNPQTQEVKGTTVRKMISRIIVTKLYAASTITDDWIQERENKLFTTNNATFKNRPAETIMFTGMNIRQRAIDDVWPVEFTFEHIRLDEKNLETLDIGTTGTISIKPFQYYWAYYMEEEDENQNVLVPKAKGFYESIIVRSSDFSTII